MKEPTSNPSPVSGLEQGVAPAFANQPLPISDPLPCVVPCLEQGLPFDDLLAGGLGEAWARNRAVEDFVCALLKHWPPGVARLNYYIVSGPSRPEHSRVMVSSEWEIPNTSRDLKIGGKRLEQIKRFEVKMENHLSDLDDGHPVMLVDIEGLWVRGDRRRTPEEWAEFPAQARSPSLRAWHLSKAMESIEDPPPSRRPRM